MSAFLGPIHYWLYDKIKIQESIVEGILDLVENDENIDYSKFSDQRKEVDEQCGCIEKESIETCIDEQNIHGWLQERVTIVEKRLSFVVTSILKMDKGLLPCILKKANEIGKEVFTSLDNKSYSTAKDIYQLINDVLLDGMPCDHINEVVEASEEEVIYRQTRCIHCEHWNAVGGESTWYYDIRIALMNGLLENTEWTLQYDKESTYKIIKK